MTASVTVVRESKNPISNTKGSYNIEADGIDYRPVEIPAGGTDVEVSVVFAIADLKLISIHSDKDVTLETNDAAAPGETFNLIANRPLIWDHQDYLSNPFTVDVTKFFFTNAGDDIAKVKILISKDSTP